MNEHESSWREVQFETHQWANIPQSAGLWPNTPPDEATELRLRTAEEIALILHAVMVTALEEAEKQHDFYTKLYRQYSADLLKMTLYVRKIITTPELGTYLADHHPATLNDLSEIVLETTAAPPPA